MRRARPSNFLSLIEKKVMSNKRDKQKIGYPVIVIFVIKLISAIWL